MYLQLADNGTLACPKGYMRLPSQGIKVREDYFDAMPTGEFQVMLNDEGYTLQDIAYLTGNRGKRLGLAAKGKGILSKVVANRAVKQERKQDRKDMKVANKGAAKQTKADAKMVKAGAKQTKADAKVIKAQSKQTKADAKLVRAESGEQTGFDKFIDKLPEVVTAGGAVVGNLVGNSLIPTTGNPVIDNAVGNIFGNTPTPSPAPVNVLPAPVIDYNEAAKAGEGRDAGYYVKAGEGKDSWFSRRTNILGLEMSNGQAVGGAVGLTLLGIVLYNKFK